MEDIIRFAIIGCGRIAPKHIAAIKAQKDAELTAVCDIVKEKAEKIGSENNCSWYFNYNELLKREDINIVNICTPHHLHASMTIDAAKAGKHIIIEKPMAMNVVEADKMIEACMRNSVKLFVVKQNRYNPPVKLLKRAIDSNRFGKIFLANATVRWSRNQSYYDKDPWKGTKSQDGGILLNQAAHHVDLLQWLLGPVDSVIGKCGTITHNIETDDTAVAIIKFKNGALATIEATTCVKNDIEGSVSVLGENGHVKIGGFAVNKIETWDFKDTQDYDLLVNQASTNPPNVYGFGHIELIRDVIDAIKGQKNSAPDGFDGKQTLELIEAIYRAIEAEKEIKLPLSANHKMQ